MGIWHEPAKRTGGVAIRSPTGNAGAIIRRNEDASQEFTATFMRYEGQGKALYWTRFPQDWIELHPRKPVAGASHQEVREQVLALLPRVEAGDTDARFIRKPYLPPKRPEKVQEIEHATHQAKAIIVKHNEKRYAVAYQVYAPDGSYFPVSTPSIGVPGWEWGRARTQTLTLADNLPDAEQVAIVELDEIVAKDPQIKQQNAV